MTKKEIKQKQNRIAEIWEELDKRLGGDLILDDISELVELELELEKECNI